MTAARTLKALAPWKKSYDKPRQHVKKQRYYFADKRLSSQGYGFPSCHVMYGCESWTIKKAECRRIDASELWKWKRLLRIPCTARRLNQSVPKEINPELIGRTDVEAEAPILWPPDVKNSLIGKDPHAGKDWRQEKGMTKDEMFGWHHWLNGHEFEQALGADDGQGSLVCCSPWGDKESDTTEHMNWTE